MGKHWYTNGTIQVQAEECPEGFRPGRLPVSEETRKKHSEHNAWHSMTDQQKEDRRAKISATKQNKTEEERQQYSLNVSKGRKGKGLGIVPWNKGTHGLQEAWNKGLHTPGRPRTEESLERARQTCRERYGVDWACQRAEAGLKGQNSEANTSFEQLLQNSGINYEREFPISHYSYDFKVRNSLIEINPYATHNSTWGIRNNPPKASTYHKTKTDTAVLAGYNCIHIFDWEDQAKIVKAFFATKPRIYARDCVVKEVPKQEALDFLMLHHIQGAARDQIRFGLYCEEKLVSIMTFGKPRYNKNYEFELIRYCSNATVVGGAEKLFKHFVDSYDASSVVSYCDLSKFTGKVYKTLGFTLLRISKPARHWFHPKTKQHFTDALVRQQGFSRLVNKKDAAFDDLSTADNTTLMLEAGFVEVYDCGQATYVWKNQE